MWRISNKEKEKMDWLKRKREDLAKLGIICKTIWLDISFYKEVVIEEYDDEWVYPYPYDREIEIEKEINEIIFNPLFMEKLREYSYDTSIFEIEFVWKDLLDELNNPVNYLFEVMELS